jgi:hypothetical protein
MRENTQLELEFPRVAGKKVPSDFEGGVVKSDAGLLLLREVERNVGIIRCFTDCIPDNSDAWYIDQKTFDHGHAMIRACSEGGVGFGFFNCHVFEPFGFIVRKKSIETLNNSSASYAIIFDRYY